MNSKGESSDYEVWRTGYVFALLLLVFLGVAIIVIGATLFREGTSWNSIIIGSGISLAPAAIIAVLFRLFLFKEIRFELTRPVAEEIKNSIRPEIREQIKELIKDYRAEILVLQSLKSAGVIKPHRRREIAVRDFAAAIDSETSEIMIIGSSLKGLLQKDNYKEIADKLKFKIDRGGVRIRFLLTHPVVADLRAGQEARKSTEIGTEIIESLIILKKWNVPTADVRLYKGTPTCFAIKTRKEMLLNPYPYGAVSYDSPCLMVETSDEKPSYFYEAFDKSHFGAWDTNVSVEIFNYDDTIKDLRNNLKTYSEKISDLLG